MTSWASLVEVYMNPCVEVLPDQVIFMSILWLEPNIIP